MVLDASVLAKLFVAEDLSDEARALVAAGGELWAPAHALAELAEVLCRKVSLNEITSDQYARAIDVAVRLVRTAPLDDLIASAVAIAQELRLSIYDTLYLALCETRRDTLVTWDKRLLRGVQDTRFENTTRPLLASWTP